MATDGADFKRRVKYHGRTYTEIKNGSSIRTVADVSVAGLARELSGDNQVKGLKDLVLATIDSLQGIFVPDSLSFHRDISLRLKEIAAKQGRSTAQEIAVESLIREAGRLRNEESTLEGLAQKNCLLAACGRDLFEALVVDPSDQYVLAHRDLSPRELPAFLDSWKAAAAAPVEALMASIFENGKPSRELLTPRPELGRVQSDSVADLTSINLAP